MDPVTSTITGAVAKKFVDAAVAHVRSSLGGPFESEIRQILQGIQGLRKWLEEDRCALLLDGFSFILQDDLDQARRSLTQARNREPRSAVVRFWLALVLASQGLPGADTEMRDALQLNPFIAPVELASLLASEGEDPADRHVLWTKNLSGRDAGVTFGALGGNVQLAPYRWAAGKIGGVASPRLERALFSGGYVWKGASSSVLMVSLGSGDPVVAWVTHPSNPNGLQLAFLSMFSARSGDLLWHRLWAPCPIPLFATPSLIAQEVSGHQYMLLSAATGELVELMSKAYVETLIAPPYVRESPAFRAAHAATALLDLAWPSSPECFQAYRDRFPLFERLAVECPAGVRLTLASESDYHGFGRYYRNIRCRSRITMTGG